MDNKSIIDNKQIQDLLKPVPSNEQEAMIRDFLDDIPILGDVLYRLAETIQAFENNNATAGIIYGANLLLPIDLPFTHMLVYKMEGEDKRQKT